MNRILLLICVASLILAACQPASHKGTIAELRHMQIEFNQEKVENGLDKAMLSYQDFLNNSPC